MTQTQEGFSVLLPGQVWRAIPGSGSEWVLEWRNLESREMGFSVVDSKGNMALKAHTTAGETDWWSSLAGVGQNCFFVHAYRNADIPQPTDLMGFELQTGRPLWVLPGHTFVGFSGSGQLVSALRVAGDLSWFECDEYTGEHLTELIEKNELSAPGWKEGDRYTEGAEHYGLLKNFLVNQVGLVPAGAIEYLDYANRMVFSFYLYKNDRLAQYVVIANRSREVEYLQMIEEGLEKEGKSVFLAKDGWVFFVKNKKSFVGVNLAIE